MLKGADPHCLIPSTQSHFKSHFNGKGIEAITPFYRALCLYDNDDIVLKLLDTETPLDAVPPAYSKINRDTWDISDETRQCKLERRTPTRTNNIFYSLTEIKKVSSSTKDLVIHKLSTRFTDVASASLRSMGLNAVECLQQYFLGAGDERLKRALDLFDMGARLDEENKNWVPINKMFRNRLMPGLSVEWNVSLPVHLIAFCQKDLAVRAIAKFIDLGVLNEWHRYGGLSLLQWSAVFDNGPVAKMLLSAGFDIKAVADSENIAASNQFHGKNTAEIAILTQSNDVQYVMNCWMAQQTMQRIALVSNSLSSLARTQTAESPFVNENNFALPIETISGQEKQFVVVRGKI